jgi:radical SAM superfamily enzyme YgiQ (UPF0313 family)
MKANIKLINCYSGNELPPDAPPYGLLYAGSALQRAGHEVRIFDRHLDGGQDVASFGESLLKGGGEIFGLGGVASAYKDAVELASYLKSRKPGCRIIAGGYLASTVQSLLRNAPVDAVVRGEGEITVVEVTDALLKGGPLDNIRGITFLKDGVIVNTPKREQIADLDEIPFPDYRLVEMKRYLVPAYKAPYFRFDPRHKRYEGVLIDIKTSRGCTNNCSFCYRHMRGIRHHSPKYVVEHMKYLQDTFKAVFFNISDELTISDAGWAEEFCRAKKDMNLDCLFRINSARVDLINEEMLSELKDAGMVAITFGIESGSQRMLDNMHKGTTVGQNIRALKICHKLGLQTTITLIVGLPGENFLTILETARFLMACPHYPNIVEYEYDDTSNLRIFAPVAFPDTLLYRQGQKLGIISDEDFYLRTLNNNEAMRGYNFSGYPDFVLKLWVHSLYFSYKMSYFWENRKFRELLRLFWKSSIILLKLPFGKRPSRSSSAGNTCRENCKICRS